MTQYKRMRDEVIIALTGVGSVTGRLLRNTLPEMQEITKRGVVVVSGEDKLADMDYSALEARVLAHRAHAKDALFRELERLAYGDFPEEKEPDPVRRNINRVRAMKDHPRNVKKAR